MTEETQRNQGFKLFPIFILFFKIVLSYLDLSAMIYNTNGGLIKNLLYINFKFQSVF